MLLLRALLCPAACVARLQVLQYRTHQSNELKLMDSWNYVFLKLATAKNPEPLAFAAELGQTMKTRKREQAANWHAEALREAAE